MSRLASTNYHPVVVVTWSGGQQLGGDGWRLETTQQYMWRALGRGRRAGGGPGFVIFNGFLDCDGNMCRVPPGRGGSHFFHVSWLVAETLQMDNVRYNIR